MAIPPVESFARMWVYTEIYAEAAERGYSEYLALSKSINEFTDVEYDEQLELYKHNRLVAGMQTIVFSAMCFEAAIYDFAAIHLGDNYVRKHIDKLDVISKWILVLRFVADVEIPKDQAPYCTFKNLITYRNRLVHAKSEKFNIEQEERLREKMSKRNQEYERNVHNAIRALILMSLYLDNTLDGYVNPLPSYNGQNAPMRRYYPVLKEVIDECQKIISPLVSE